MFFILMFWVHCFAMSVFSLTLRVAFEDMQNCRFFPFYDLYLVVATINSAADEWRSFCASM